MELTIIAFTQQSQLIKFYCTFLNLCESESKDFLSRLGYQRRNDIPETCEGTALNTLPENTKAWSNLLWSEGLKDAEEGKGQESACPQQASQWCQYSVLQDVKWNSARYLLKEMTHNAEKRTLLCKNVFTKNI